jgi:hypothetical protein
LLWFVGVEGVGGLTGFLELYVVNKSDLPTEEKLSQNCTGSAEVRTGNGEKQIPFGNDRKNGKSKSKGKYRGPSLRSG